MPERQNWITVQYVYRSGVSKKRYCKRIAVRVIEIKDAKEYGCGTIQITGSDMGV